MRLRVLGSGSDANGYILYNESEALVIECGVPYSRCLRALDFRRGMISGAIVSHEHGDHAKYARQYLDASVPVYASGGTLEKIDKGGSARMATAVINRCLFRVGSFSVLPFDVCHDSAEPFGYLVSHKEMGVCLFATDTYYLRYRFEGLTQVMLECNYDKTILDRNVEKGVVPAFVSERTLRSHMSLDTTVATLSASDLSQVSNVVLLHLSSHNSDPELFRGKVAAATGKLVSVATSGLDIPFGKVLF